MGKFKDVAAGTNARRVVPLPLLNGGTVAVAVVPLLLGADNTCLQGAREYAKSKGVEDPKPGDPLYERGLMMHTVLAGVMDPDVPDRREPFFDSIEQMNDLMDPDGLAYLFHHQREFQAEVAPLPKSNDLPTYSAWVFSMSMAGEDQRVIPLGYLPLKTERSFMARLASSYLTLLQLKLPSGSKLQEITSALENGLPVSDGTPSTDSPKAGASPLTTTPGDTSTPGRTAAKKTRKPRGPSVAKTKGRRR